MPKPITASCVGGYGRLGNAVTQFLGARQIAEEIGATLKIPSSWIGWDVWHLDAEPMTEQPQRFDETFIEELREKDPTRFREGGFDCYGYFQRPEQVSRLSRKKCKEWMQPKIKKEGHKAVAHIRRGDYTTTDGYAVVSLESYQRAFSAAGYDIDEVAIYSDQPNLCRNGARPVHSNPYEDWLEINASRTIFRSNSTYSWTAALLSDAEEIYSPIVRDKGHEGDYNFAPNNDEQVCWMFGSLKTKE